MRARVWMGTVGEAGAAIGQFLRDRRKGVRHAAAVMELTGPAAGCPWEVNRLMPIPLSVAGS